MPSASEKNDPTLATTAVLKAEAQVFSQLIGGFDAGTVSRQQICHVKLTNLGRSPVNLLVGEGEQMQTTDDAVDWFVIEVLLGERYDVHDSGVSASEPKNTCPSTQTTVWIKRGMKALRT